MPRYNVEADGEWACFSSIPDAFLTPFMPMEEYEKWRADEYGNSRPNLESANRMSLKKALFRLSMNKGDDEIMANMRESGLFYIDEMEAHDE